VTSAYRRSFFHPDSWPGHQVGIASARAGNVIGGGDWAPDRLVPDIVRAWAAGEAVVIRNPEAVRPWQHVLEPLSGYLSLAEALVKTPDGAPRAVNFGPDPASFCTVREVVDAFGARIAGKTGWARDSGPQPPEAQSLTLSSALARQSLGWHPRLDIQESLSWTADWYSAYSAGEDMLAFTESQIARYGAMMKRLP
jgi:CDP-glucose 4,6-dehydratase